MTTNTKKKTEMDSKGTNVCTSFTANPEYTEILFVIVFDHLTLIDGTHTQLSFNGSNDWWTLEKSTCKFLESLCENTFIFNWCMETNNTNVFLT